ncbi:hypothetical protein SADUNF_Sadunf16G0087200 [Salix dunnii]|uniref:RRM domain-containing protein n=1 Tax=Salix dunnii TaxID=1413687 RepID=A0A835J8U4_9ROSI|nr:hypothetical protein SADUNF_Sadunf16G0087200 [Salix dunnii]
MPRYDDRYANTRLYVGHLAARTRSRDLEHLFSKYGRENAVAPVITWATFRPSAACFARRFVLSVWEFSDPRDADDARHYLDGKDFDGSRIIVEFAKGVSSVKLMYLVVLKNIWGEFLLQDLDAASTVALMVTGLEIAKLETGRTSAPRSRSPPKRERNVENEGRSLSPEPKNTKARKRSTTPDEGSPHPSPKSWKLDDEQDREYSGNPRGRSRSP